ncbi:unnamed protein product [Durusdinium trenchii]
MHLNGTARAIAAGTSHSLILMDSGEVLSVGSNIHGQLGLGHNEQILTPKPMPLDARAVAVAAGDLHSLVVTEDGRCFGAGGNSDGQLGVPGIQEHNMPVRMKITERVLDVAAGWSYSLMVSDNGIFTATWCGSAGVELERSWNELVRPEELLLGPQLGAGGSAQVFRGSWKGQEVAVKRITGVAHLEAMKKEVDALRRLRHPRLVRFLGACVQPPLLLVVTEFMAGGSLHDRLFGRSQLAATSALGPRQRWLIACQTAEGLSFLHSQRVVHRDLKSMNILLDAGQNAKICDFGLAHQMCMESTHIARKLDGEGGSPRYMAPECYDASVGKLTEKVDIWAAGCILIELWQMRELASQLVLVYWRGNVLVQCCVSGDQS